jgi:hypothetical protein
MAERPQDRDRNQEATVYLVSRPGGVAAQFASSHADELLLAQGNLDERCTDALIWELML